jgi:predicted transcriptional regulator
MARPASTQPTELELEILKILWRQGPSTVRQVREALAPTRKLAHTSVITVMGIMTEKGYLDRDAEGNTHIFRAQVSAQAVRKRMLGDLVRRAFDGSAIAMMLNLLDTSELQDEELAELRRRLNEKGKDV